MAGIPLINPQNPNQIQMQQPPPPPPPSIAATLLIRHLPEAIPEDTLSRLFSHYGASSVRPCSANGRMRNCAFLDFPNDALAFQAHRQLNGLRFLGKVLKAEKASKQPQDDNKPQPGSHEAQSSVLSTSGSKENASEQVSKPGSLPAADPIAPRLGVDYPFPPYLEYAYPPPDGNILTNIVNALIAVPRFYTQVLHLMNKMNIPAPFRMAMPTPPLPPLAPVPPPPPPPLESTKQSLVESSSEESEMESSDEEAENVNGGSRGLKRARREAIVGPAVDKDVAHETVGLKPATLVPKERPIIKKRNPVLQIKLAHKPVQKEHNDDEITKETDDLKSEALDIKPYASPEEIQGGKLGPEELLSLPVFKNYKAGNPAPVLYIKNLAKDVLLDDFYYIFGSLFGSTDLAKSSLSVKLMQEGRMRGQAFVTFPSVELAQNALNLVNGYEFKGKPMVIQFGRNPTAAKEK
ncbi:U11/U12 small nuclear ribonucleoprotein 65 kDa protein [Humulus lupulus]|uniref:U11/U12 small nuclear ribonucleoprotein 65 kDa protein n=1 Tax=Humulus lupulus TaxID=3486 RepID=UPI002B4166DE|nr:U11/U12 small nuclear ribonucleoprotein 65 kDa protein [Humulus lupulus]